MAFCTNCGAEIQDGVSFCTKCGTPIADAPTTPIVTSPFATEVMEPVIGGVEPDVTQSTTPDAAPPTMGEAVPLTPPQPPKRRPWVIPVVAAACALVLGVGAYAVSAAIRGTDLTDSSSAQETEQAAENDAKSSSDPIEAAAFAFMQDEEVLAGINASSEWCENDDFKVADKIVHDVQGSQSEEGEEGTYYNVLASAVCENSSFRVTRDYILRAFEPKSGSVDFYDVEWEGDFVEPIAGVSDSKILEHVPTLLGLADMEPHKDVAGNSISLEKVYQENLEYALNSNNTSASGGVARVGISASDGFANYAGELSANFAWDGSDWVVESCEANDAAYQADYNSLIGTWTGTRHDGNAAVGQDCMAGRTIPFTLTITDIDSASRVMRCDVSYVVHLHEWVDGIADSSEGDEIKELRSMLVPLYERIGESVRIYNPQDLQYPETSRSIDLTFTDNGSIEVMAYNSFKYDSHYDFYTLTKDGGTSEAHSDSNENDSTKVAAASGVTSPSFSKASASSVCTTDDVELYDPYRATDGKASSAWVTDQATAGDGTGQWIELSNENLQHIQGIRIMPGFCKSTEVYAKNRRPHDITITFSDGTSQQASLADVFGEYQDIPLSTAVDTTTIRVTIDSTYAPTYNGKTYDDCAISEIEVY